MTTATMTKTTATAIIASTTKMVKLGAESDANQLVNARPGDRVRCPVCTKNIKVLKNGKLAAHHGAGFQCPASCCTPVHAAKVRVDVDAENLADATTDWQRECALTAMYEASAVLAYVTLKAQPQAEATPEPLTTPSDLTPEQVLAAARKLYAGEATARRRCVAKGLGLRLVGGALRKATQVLADNTSIDLTVASQDVRINGASTVVTGHTLWLLCAELAD